jgi:hypothetical protein
MIMEGDGLRPELLPWSLSGGVLELGNSTYLRDDRQPGNTISLVGYWINLNLRTTIRFGPDGSFEFTDDTRGGERTVGTYRLDGQQLTLSSSTKGSSTYFVSLDGLLTFADANGRPLAEYSRAG